MVGHCDATSNSRDADPEVDATLAQQLQYSISDDGEHMREQINAVLTSEAYETLPALLMGAEVRSLRYASDRLANVLDEEALFEYIERWLAAPGPAPHLACQLLPHGYLLDRKRALAALPPCIESEDWTLRDAACEITGRLLRSDFTSMLGVLETWRAQDSLNLARSVVVATIRAADPMHLERAEPLLKLVEPLLPIRAPLVRRNLGPSAIGLHLLTHYPTATFEYLVKWSTSNDSQVLWNVAMAFSTPAAVPITKKALIVLRKLSLDERRLVWRAVSSAIWKLGRKRPDIIRPELARWLEDERRVKVAREAIKHL